MSEIMLSYFIIYQEFLMQKLGVGKMQDLRDSFKERTHKIKVEMLVEKAWAS